MPRSAPGPITSSSSMRTSPSVGASSPPMIDSSVDLPHPEAPRRQTSSPSSTCRSTPSSAATDDLRPVNVFDTPRDDELVVGQPAGGGDLHHAFAQGAMRPRNQRRNTSLTNPITPKTMSRANMVSTARKRCGLDDLERQALLGREQLGHHEHQPGGGEVDAGHVDDARQRVRQDHPAHDGAARRPERVRGVEQLTGHVAGHVGDHEDVVEDRAHHDEPDLGALVDAQPQQEQRREGGGRDVAQEPDLRLEERLDRGEGADGDAEDGADHHRDAVADGHALHRRREVALEGAGGPQVGEGLPGGRRGGDQRRARVQGVGGVGPDREDRRHAERPEPDAPPQRQRAADAEQLRRTATPGAGAGAGPRGGRARAGRCRGGSDRRAGHVGNRAVHGRAHELVVEVAVEPVGFAAR